MNILVISQIFPNSLHPYEGNFVLKKIMEIAKREPVKVLAPVYVRPFQKSPVPFFEIFEGLEVYHPRVWTLPVITRWINGFLYFLCALPTFLRIRKIFPPAVLFAHFIYPDGFAAVLFSKLFKTSCVSIALGSDIQLARTSKVKEQMTYYTLKNSKKIICISEDLRQKTMRMAGCGEGDVVVNYNGVDIPKSIDIDRDQFCAENGLNRGMIMIVTVGHFISLKNHMSLIQMMPQFKNRCQLLIIGSGPERSHYDKAIEKFDLRDAVKILGPFSHSALQNWYRVSDLMIHPSFSEGIPNVVLEAMTFKIPVIASNVGGVSEMIKDGVTGFLFNPADQKRLWFLAEKLMNDGALRKTIGEQGYRFITEGPFSWEQSADGALRVLRETQER